MCNNSFGQRVRRQLRAKIQERERQQLEYEQAIFGCSAAFFTDLFRRAATEIEFLATPLNEFLARAAQAIPAAETPVELGVRPRRHRLNEF